jgi:protein-L-isoaspartate(D-aspartate) O-methyltransferase
VLEIGTGSGYQAAILSSLAKEVYTIEIVEPLAQSASAVLNRLGYHNVVVQHGDGYGGWSDKAPFDRIVLTAAPPELPTTLIDQLKPGGKLLAPVGDQSAA